jgi:hypothetical protein
MRAANLLTPNQSFTAAGLAGKVAACDRVFSIFPAPKAIQIADAKL